MKGGGEGGEGEGEGRKKSQEELLPSPRWESAREESEGLMVERPD